VFLVEKADLVSGRHPHNRVALISEVNKQRERKNNTEERRIMTQLLYGGDYRRRRREALAGASVCYLCKETFKPGDRVEADHIFPGDPHSPLAAKHRLCNQRKGDKPLTN
jgi:hypothetical protein